MDRLLHVLVPAGLVALATGCAAPSPRTAEVADWRYPGDAGPGAWGELSEGFAACAEGRRQSPIDLFATPPGDGFPAPAFHYLPARLDAVNNGHTVRFNFDGRSKLVFEGDTWWLENLHFHVPGEHTFAGERFPMELHFVHAAESAPDRYLIVAVPVDEGRHDPGFDPLCENLPSQAGAGHVSREVVFDPEDLLPSRRGHYSYEGSFTTPPCAESVRWIVFETPVEIGEAQIDAFREVHAGNSRPTQPAHGRAVGYSSF